MSDQILMAFNILGGSFGAVIAGVTLGAVAACGIAQAAPVDPTGTWLSEDGITRVRIDMCGPLQENLCLYVVHVKNAFDANGAPRLDVHNSDPAKRGRPVLGHQRLLGLKPNAEGTYEGQLYWADYGRTFNISATFGMSDPEHLKVRGCTLFIICENLSWKRVTDVLPGQLTGPTDGPDGPRSDAEWVRAPVPVVSKRASPSPKR